MRADRHGRVSRSTEKRAREANITPAATRRAAATFASAPRSRGPAVATTLPNRNRAGIVPRPEGGHGGESPDEPVRRGICPPSRSAPRRGGRCRPFRTGASPSPSRGGRRRPGRLPRPRVARPRPGRPGKARSPRSVGPRKPSADGKPHQRDQDAGRGEEIRLEGGDPGRDADEGARPPDDSPAMPYVVIRPMWNIRCGRVAARFRSVMAYPATSGPHIPTQWPAPPASPVTKRIHGRESVGHGKMEDRLSGARRAHRRLPVAFSARAPAITPVPRIVRRPRGKDRRGSVPSPSPPSTDRGTARPSRRIPEGIPEFDLPHRDGRPWGDREEDLLSADGAAQRSRRGGRRSGMPPVDEPVRGTVGDVIVAPVPSAKTTNRPPISRFTGTPLSGRSGTRSPRR